MSHWNKTASSAAFILSTALAATGCLATADTTDDATGDAETAVAADARTGDASQALFGDEHFCHPGLFNYYGPFVGQFGGNCCGLPFFGGGVGGPFVGVGPVGVGGLGGCL